MGSGPEPRAWVGAERVEVDVVESGQERNEEDL